MAQNESEIRYLTPPTVEIKKEEILSVQEKQDQIHRL